LAEFILVDRRRIHSVLHPYMSDQPPLVLASLSESEDGDEGHRNSLAFPSANEPKGLTVDELALLPLSGILVYRTVRTLTRITRVLVKPDAAARRPHGNRRSPEVTSHNVQNVVIVCSIKHGLGYQFYSPSSESSTSSTLSPPYSPSSCAPCSIFLYWTSSHSISD
jgi:hypothetical protein